MATPTTTLPTTPFDSLPPRAKEGDHPATPDTRLPPSNPSLTLLHHDPSRYIVVIKPCDVRMDGPFTHTVETLLRSYHTPTPEAYPRFVHRLDYATSGVLLVALTRLTASIAATQFEQKLVRKEYLAIVHGHMTEPLVLQERIASCEGSFRMLIGTTSNPGRAARTEVHPVSTGFYNGFPVTKVRLVPVTGRRHQLRLHLSNAGYPIVGDATYAPGMEGAFVAPRMMLHAWRLEIGLPQGRLYGRKSAIRNVVKKVFDAGDCFEGLEGLVLDT